MKQSLALLTRSFARHRGAIIGLGLVLIGFQVLLTTIAANLYREGRFLQLTAIIPPFIQQALGGLGIASFGGLVAFGFFHPIVVIALVLLAIYLGSEPAGEVELGLVDLIAARPVPRHLLVTRSAVLFATASGVIVIAMLVASRTAGYLLTPPGAIGPRATAMLWLSGNLTAVAWCFGAAGLAAASHARRRGAAAGGVGVAAVCLYLLHVAAAAWPGARRLDLVSPFHYYDPMPILLGMRSPQSHVVCLLGVTLVLFGWAQWAYGRRDL